MSLTVTNTPVSYAGETEQGKVTNNWLPLAAFQQPQWDNYVYEQTNKWWLTPFLSQYGGEKEPLAANEWNWAEKGKFYTKHTIASATGSDGGPFAITIAGGEFFYLEREIVDLGAAYPGKYALNLLARITSVNNGGANQVITATLIDPETAATGVTAASLADNEIGLIYNSQAECFTMRPGRKYAPEKITNQLVKMNDTYEVCDDAENQTYWVKSPSTGRNYWTDEIWVETLDNHRMQCDSALIYGQPHTFTDGTYDGVAGKGLLYFMEASSPIFRIAGTIIEDDVQEILTEMGIYSKFNSWDLIVGPHLYRDLLQAMQDYFMDGGVFYFDFGDGGGSVGVNYNQYRFGQKTLNLMEYEGFGDPDFLPQTGVDYRKIGMLLNTDSGDLKVVYKKRNRGGKVKEWINNMSGPTMAGNGQPIQDADACFKATITTHLGLEFKGALNHGLITE